MLLAWPEKSCATRVACSTGDLQHRSPVTATAHTCHQRVCSCVTPHALTALPPETMGLEKNSLPLRHIWLLLDCLQRRHATAARDNLLNT